MKVRVVIAMALLLLLAKVVSVATPVFCKAAVDALTGETDTLDTAPVPGHPGRSGSRSPTASPGSCRWASSGCADSVFAMVAQRALQALALGHRGIHALCCAVHTRKTACTLPGDGTRRERAWSSCSASCSSISGRCSSSSPWWR
ncbi:MAG: hypothetical protein R3D59_09100 [Paracoccaceae bacterium]